MFIKEVDLFWGMPSHFIDEIAVLCNEEVFTEGSVVFDRGDSADALFILEEGLVEITVGEEGHFCFSVDRSGNMFGWSALVEPNQYTASAKCVKKSKVIRIDGNRLMHVFDRHPVEGMRIMRRLSGLIASRLVRTYEQILSSQKETEVRSYG